MARVGVRPDETGHRGVAASSDKNKYEYVRNVAKLTQIYEQSSSVCSYAYRLHV